MPSGHAQEPESRPDPWAAPWLTTLTASAIGIALALAARHGGDPGAPASIRRASRDPVRAAVAYVHAWTQAEPEHARALSRGRASAGVDTPPPWGLGEGALEVEEVHEGTPTRVLGEVRAGGRSYPVTLEVAPDDGHFFVRALNLGDAGAP